MSILRILARKPENIPDLTRLIKYVVDVEKTGGRVDSIGVTVENASREFALVHEAYQWRTNVLALHWLLSFDSTADIDTLTAMALAKRITGFWSGYQHVFGIHSGESNPNLHVHCVTNRVSAINGEILDTCPSNLFAWKVFTNTILMSNGLEPIKIMKEEFYMNQFYPVIAENGFTVANSWEWAAATATQHKFINPYLRTFSNFDDARNWAYATFAAHQIYYCLSKNLPVNVNLPPELEINRAFLCNYREVIDVVPEPQGGVPPQITNSQCLPFNNF